MIEEPINEDKWGPLTEAKLRELAAEKSLSSSDIAKALDKFRGVKKGYSRSAVIGKISRLKIKRYQGIDGKRKEIRNKAPRTVVPFIAPAPSRDIELEDSENLDLVQFVSSTEWCEAMKFDSCRYFEDGPNGSLLACPSKKEPGQSFSYCLHHLNTNILNKPKKEEAAI